MDSLKVNKGINEGQKIDCRCSKCKRFTKHLILTDIQELGDEDRGRYGHVFWSSDYQIVQCQGCETITFRMAHENSEDYDFCYDNSGQEMVFPVQTIVQYPDPVEGRVPINDIYLIPKSLSGIYSETLSSLNSNHAILTGIGIRAIVETICKDKEAKGNNLANKINDLVEQGLLTQDGAKIFHQLRVLGNKSAHEVKPHDKTQLSLAIDVIEHLMQGVYILPHQAESQFK